MQLDSHLIALAYGLLFAIAVIQYRTAQRQAQRFAAIEQAMRENAVRLDTTLAHMDQGLMMIDARGDIVVCNAQVRQLLGLPVDLPLIGRPFDELVRYQWEKREFVRADISAYDFLRTGGIERAPPVYERLRPDGTAIEIRTRPLEAGGYVRTYTDVTARRLAETTLREQATTDDLTGLANRLSFRRHLQAALNQHAAGGLGFALLYMDLDRFKFVNDTYGHPMGDRLLAAVAARLQGQARTTDVVARLGGDEFAMLVFGADEKGASVLAERIAVVVTQPVPVGDVVLEVGVSIGIALPDRAETEPEELLRKADIALYEVKKAGQPAWRIHGRTDALNTA